jgi:hypothetical protein
MSWSQALHEHLETLTQKPLCLEVPDHVFKDLMREHSCPHFYVFIDDVEVFPESYEGLRVSNFSKKPR